MTRGVLLVDDHPIVRAGVAQLIRERWPDAVLGEAGTLAEALQQLRESTWSALVLDLSLPDAQGLEGLQRLRGAAPDLPVLVLSQHAEAAYAARALQAGARAYLTKDRAGTELMMALERVQIGGRYVTASLAETLTGLLIGVAVDRPLHEVLSPQEHRVMLHLAAGHSVGEVAEIMSLSVKTVSTYRRRILDKLQLRNNAELIRYCFVQELIAV